MRTVTSAAVFVALAVLSACGQPAPEGGPGGSATAAAPAGRGKLSWESSWDSAFRRARSENRVVMVEFYADWCVWCKRMESSTFVHPEVVALLAQGAVPLRIDGEREGRVLAGRYRVDGYPTIVFLSPDEREVGRIPGYLDATEFVKTASGWVRPGQSG